MNTTEAVKALREHNRWRRAEASEIPDGIPDTSPPHSARDIGIAIDVLCDENERLQRGEFVCRKCGLRKDADHVHAEF